MVELGVLSEIDTETLPTNDSVAGEKVGVATVGAPLEA
jgi:hypothetical protein